MRLGKKIKRQKKWFWFPNTLLNCQIQQPFIGFIDIESENLVNDEIWVKVGSNIFYLRNI